MRSVRKLRSVAFADEPRLAQGRSVEGVVIGLGTDGKAKFRDEDGQINELRVPRHVSALTSDGPERGAVVLGPTAGQGRS
jgi:hypothetical protein